MARRYVLPEIAKKQKTTVDQLVTDAMRKHGNPFRAAVAIGVTTNTVRNYIIRHGWTFQNGEWVEPESEKELSA